jgi:hypothetical protein
MEFASGGQRTFWKRFAGLSKTFSRSADGGEGVDERKANVSLVFRSRRTPRARAPLYAAITFFRFPSPFQAA